MKTLLRRATLSLLMSSCSLYQIAQAEPLYRHTVSVQTGAYSLKSDRSSLSSAGSLNLSYEFHIEESWYATAAYQMILQSSGFSSNVSGFDLGGGYCFFNCVATQREVGGMIEITEQSHFGLSVGAGFAQRSFSFTSQSVAYSGPYANLTGMYYLGSHLKALASAQILRLANGVNTLQGQVISIGAGFDF